MVNIDQHSVKKVVMGKIHKNMDGYVMCIKISSVRDFSKREEIINLSLYADTKQELKIVRSKEEYPS